MAHPAHPVPVPAAATPVDRWGSSPADAGERAQRRRNCRSGPTIGRIGVAIRPFVPRRSRLLLTQGSVGSVRGLGYTRFMAPRPVPHMPPSTRRNQMLMLVFGTGLATGLHLGLLHLVLWRSWKAPVSFFLASSVFSLATYALWRWVFPTLGGRSFASRLVRQAVACVVVLAAVSVAVVGTSTWLAGGIGLFGTPSGREIHLT